MLGFMRWARLVEPGGHTTWTVCPPALMRVNRLLFSPHSLEHFGDMRLNAGGQWLSDLLKFAFAPGGIGVDWVLGDGASVLYASARNLTDEKRDIELMLKGEWVS